MHRRQWIQRMNCKYKAWKWKWKFLSPLQLVSFIIAKLAISNKLLLLKPNQFQEQTSNFPKPQTLVVSWVHRTLPAISNKVISLPVLARYYFSCVTILNKNCRLVFRNFRPSDGSARIIVYTSDTSDTICAYPLAINRIRFGPQSTPQEGSYQTVTHPGTNSPNCCLTSTSSVTGILPLSYWE